MMHMTFYWGTQATILFDGWKTSTYTNYTLSLVALLLSSVLLQYLTHLRLSSSSSSSSVTGKSSSSDVKVSLLGRSKVSAPLGKKALRSAVFGVRVGLGYLLMLAAMSFNAGVFIAIVLGFVAGNFLFASEAVSTGADLSSKDADACGCA